MSEMLMLLSEGKSQRFTETAYEDTKYLENISKIIKEKVERVPDAEIYTDVFSKYSSLKSLEVIFFLCNDVTSLKDRFIYFHLLLFFNF